MYDAEKFKLAFPLCSTTKFIFNMAILFYKSHFKEGNFFCGSPGSVSKKRSVYRLPIRQIRRNLVEFILADKKKC